MFASLAHAQSKWELSFHLGYSNPLLETRGGKLTINATEDQIFIDGKRLVVADNFGADGGYTANAFVKYNVAAKGYAKLLFNLGYNQLLGIAAGPSDYDIGVRIVSFSLGLGTEINPLGDKRFYPSVFGLMRLNFIGGESFHAAGLDFFKVTNRLGYTAGLNMNYKISPKIGIYLGGSYSFDNSWNRQTDPSTPVDAHVIVFNDAAGSTNGLTHDRRVAYSSFYAGMNFYLR
jgi:hypothetical protein